jgi:ribonuclease T2
MQRGDVTVISISAVLTAVVAAAVACSVLFFDGNRSTLVSDNSSDSSWLVLTWSPSFCKTQPANPECRSGELTGLERTLILHGLWPQPRDNQYCGVSQRLKEVASRGRGDLPPIDVSDGVRADLQSTMADSSHLSLHEWYAHGTCSGVTPDVYFGDALALTARVRETLDPVFRDADGGQLPVSAVRARMDERFGPGAGERVGLSCLNAKGEGAYVVDVRLSLPSVAALRTTDESLDLGTLLSQAPPITSECAHGIVP